MASGYDNLAGTAYSLNSSQVLRTTVTFGPFSTYGTSSATGATSLTDAAATWVAHEHIGKTIYSNGKTGVCTENTDTVATVASWTGGTPTAVRTYAIGAAGLNGGIGTATVATRSANARILLRSVVPFFTVSPASVNQLATMALGTDAKPTFFNAATLVSAAGQNLMWFSATPGSSALAVPAGFQNITWVADTLVITVAAEEVVQGALQFFILYDSLTDGGYIS